MVKAEDARGLDIVGVSKVFAQPGKPDFKALDDVSLTIRSNEFFTLLGPSGCGKTTLLRMIAGFEHPTLGEIRLDGQSIGALPPFARPVNTVFQSYALFPHLTVAGNIAFGLEMLKRPSAEIAETVTRMLRLVRMEEMRERKIGQISGGQQQRVALARALAPRPKILLLDEPLSALDLKLRKEMQIELKRLQAETGITFIFVTHDQEEALTMSDRIAVMSEGRVLQVGSPREIYEHPTSRFVASFIGETNFLEGTVESAGPGAATVRLPGGATLSAGLPEGAAASGAATIVVRPEHAALVPAPQGTLTGRIESSIYFGTDTHHHVKLADGTPFIVRSQSRRGAEAEFPPGTEVGIAIPDRAAQVLRG
ncbi:ABC transporter ATP-binding protein [Labrys wisconsinensis]|uniref:Spermidine/putrescine import ATP-binding protein PotA n=1 Tax=Labrys wisconsinensis TaxID=425677 RepID=A0ABU0JEM9_9HYPH|nr:ABC transporter ATP-binding protein [Labrys wisconsinensis]MDQ0471734.1 spermidine/putrescine transport system ATP-binding protein [Labrys wisconsinensis]